MQFVPDNCICILNDWICNEGIVPYLVSFTSNRIIVGRDGVRNFRRFSIDRVGLSNFTRILGACTDEYREKCTTGVRRNLIIFANVFHSFPFFRETFPSPTWRYIYHTSVSHQRFDLSTKSSCFHSPPYLMIEQIWKTFLRSFTPKFLEIAWVFLLTFIAKTW